MSLSWGTPHQLENHHETGDPGRPRKKTKKTRPRLARKQNIASEVGPTLQDAFFFPTRSIREASARQHQARCSAQTGRCKLVCASCSTQVALCKLLCASCSAQVAPASWSLQVAPCKLLCANCAPCKLLCASCSVQVALCILRRPPRTREESNPRPAGSGSRRANHETTPEDQFEQPRVFAPPPRRFPQRVARAPQKSQKTMGFCTSTTPIPAEGRASRLEIAKNHGFLHLDHADPRRGSREQVRNRKKP